MKYPMVIFIYKNKIISKQRMNVEFKLGDEIRFGDVYYIVINRKRNLNDIPYPADIQHNCGDYIIELELKNEK